MWPLTCLSLSYKVTCCFVSVMLDLKFSSVPHSRFNYVDGTRNGYPIAPQTGCCPVQGRLQPGFPVLDLLGPRWPVDNEPQRVLCLSNGKQSQNGLAKNPSCSVELIVFPGAQLQQSSKREQWTTTSDVKLGKCLRKAPSHAFLIALCPLHLFYMFAGNQQRVVAETCPQQSS